MQVSPPSLCQWEVGKTLPHGTFRREATSEDLGLDGRLCLECIMKKCTQYVERVHLSQVTGYCRTYGHQWAVELSKELFTFLRRILLQSASLLFCWLFKIIISGMHKVYNDNPNSNKIRRFHPQNLVLWISKWSGSPSCFRLFPIYLSHTCICSFLHNYRV
jgi:TM2 domain-containing membrane protein YozV